MKRAAAGLALLVAALEARFVDTRVLAVLTPTPAPVSKLFAKALTSASAARIKAKGLDPASPNLKTLLASLAAADGRAAHRVPAFRTLPAPAAVSRVSLSQAVNARGKGTASERPPRFITPKINDIYGGPAASLHNTTALSEGGTQGIVVVGDYDASGVVSAQVDLGPCGVVRMGGLVVALKFFFPQLPPSLGNLPAFSTGAKQDAFPDGQAGQLSLVVNGMASNALAVTTGQYWKVTHAVDVTIASAAPHFTPGGDTGLTPDQMITPGGDRLSTVPDYQGGTGGTGVDELGAGVYLMNGYTATAKIVRAHSYMDAPGYSATSDGYRGATIQQQPAAGRLFTKVAWSYAAGESLDYDIEWTLIGSPMKRPLSSMPKPACGD